MNSEYAASKRAALFGAQSPLKGIQNERGLDASFRNFFASNANANYRDRIFSGYREFLNLAGLNRTYVEQVVRELISPFVGFNYAAVMEKLEKPATDFDLDVARGIIRENLKKLFSTSNISVVLDRGEFTNEFSSNKSGMRFAFDYVRADSTSDLKDPLKFDWLNGVIEFAAKTEASVAFFIPLSYLRNAVREGFSAIASSNNMNINDVLPNVAFAKAREIVSNDIVISILQGIYVDRAREFVVGQLRTLFTVAEIFLGSLSSMPTDDSSPEEWTKFYEATRASSSVILRGRFALQNDEYKASPELGEFLRETFNGGLVNVHPLTLFNYIFSVNDVEANGLICRLPTIAGVDKVETYDRNNVVNREYLEHDFADDSADLLALALDTVRTLPIILLAIFIYGGGTKIGYYQRFAAVVRDFVKTLRSAAMGSMNTRVFTRYANSIESYLEFGESTLGNARLTEVLPKMIYEVIDTNRDSDANGSAPTPAA